MTSTASTNASNETTISIIPVGKKWFVVASINDQTIEESERYSSQAAAIDAAGKMAYRMGTNRIEYALQNGMAAVR